MNFMKYPTKNDISISNAVLKLAKLQNAERLELTAATGAVIVTSGRMTVKELLSTVQSLTGRAAELMTLLRLTCGDCTNCSENVRIGIGRSPSLSAPLWSFPIGRGRMRVWPAMPSWTAMWTRTRTSLP